jgi:hypothetical protein
VRGGDDLAREPVELECRSVRARDCDYRRLAGAASACETSFSIRCCAAGAPHSDSPAPFAAKTGRSRKTKLGKTAKGEGRSLHVKCYIFLNAIAQPAPWTNVPT